MIKGIIRGCLVLLVVLGAGCARPWQGFPTAVSPGLVWPAPPEPARVAFVMQIRHHEDLFESAGFWRGLGEVLGGKPDSSMIRPFALATHPAGGLLVTDPGRARVHFYCWGKRRYYEIGPRLKGGLPSPVGVAALADGRILVSDSRIGSVEAFDPASKPLGALIPAGTFGRPAGLAVNNERGEIYVADVTKHCIRVFGTDGKALRTMGRHGNGPGEFNFPTHLALDGQGRLMVTDSMNFRVQILQPDGTPVGAFGELGDAPGRFSKPKGIAVDSTGNIIVVEGLFDALQFFDEKGQLLLNIGSPGQQPGQFWLPGGLFYDPGLKLLFVADSYNKRIQVFRMTEGGGQ